METSREALGAQYEELSNMVSRAGGALMEDPKSPQLLHEYTDALTRLREFQDQRALEKLNASRGALMNLDVETAENLIREGLALDNLGSSAKGDLEKFAEIVEVDQALNKEAPITDPEKLLSYAKFCLSDKATTLPDNRFRARRALSFALVLTSKDEPRASEIINLLPETVPPTSARETT